jgi:hypothetical protein
VLRSKINNFGSRKKLNEPGFVSNFNVGKHDEAPKLKKYNSENYKSGKNLTSSRKKIEVNHNIKQNYRAAKPLRDISLPRRGATSKLQLIRKLSFGRNSNDQKSKIVKLVRK